MKSFLKIAVIIMLFSVLSCRDTKKEEATEKVTTEIETIEVETDSIFSDLEQEAKDLEKELEQLNND